MKICSYLNTQSTESYINRCGCGHGYGAGSILLLAGVYTDIPPPVAIALEHKPRAARPLGASVTIVRLTLMMPMVEHM